MQQTRVANPANELTAITTTTGDPWAAPVYDAAGNMTSIPAPVAVPSWAGLATAEWSRLTTDDWATLPVAEPAPASLAATYDAWNRLVKLTQGGQPVQTQQYDARHDRVVRQRYLAGVLATTHHEYYSDDWRLLEERVDTATTPERQFVWGGRYVDDLVLRDRSTSGTLNERLYALQDANWNVTAVTDAAGTVQERYESDPYGVTTPLSPTFEGRSTSAYDWETTYAGYRRDAATGLFAVRNRYYHPKLGVWVTRDPLDRNLSSLYEYVNGAPLILIDPFGLESAGYHHNYPLYLGGHNDQPLFWLEAEQHTAFHDYFRELFNTNDVENFRGYGKGPRDHWKAMTEAQQNEHIQAAMRKAGICDADIKKYWSDITKGANPGVQTTRVPGKGIRIGGPKATKPPGMLRRGFGKMMIFLGIYSAASDFVEGAQGAGKHAGQEGLLPGLGNVAHGAVMGKEAEAVFEGAIKAGGKMINVEGGGQTRCRRALKSGVDPTWLENY